MTGADERRGGNADAHAADAREITVPGVGEVAPDGKGNFLLVEIGQVRKRFLRADDDDFLEGRAGVELGAGGVVHAPGKIGLHFASEIGLGEGQAGAAGGAGADEAMLAGVGVDVDETPGFDKSFGANLGALLAVAAAMERDAAFLVGNDDLHAVFEHGRFEQAAINGALGRIGADDLDRFVLDHRADDLLDFLRPRFVAEQIIFEAGRGLLAGHRGRLVVEDDIGDVLAVFDRVGDGDLAAVEEGRVAHEYDLLVGDERVDAEAGRAAQAHAAVVVHEVLVRLEHEHRVAAGVAVKDEVDRFAAVRFAHVIGVAKHALDLAEDAGRIAMRAAGAEGGRARREVDDDLAIRGEQLELGGDARLVELQPGRAQLDDERREQFDQNRRIKAARGGKALAPAGKHLAVDGEGGLARDGPAGEEMHDLLFEEAAAFLDDDDVFDLIGEGINQVGIERVGNAELEERERAGEAELLQRVLEIGKCETGTDKAERLTASGFARPARTDAIDPVAARAGPEAFVALGKALFAAPGAGRKQDVLFKVDPGRVELNRIVRIDPGEMIAPDLDRAAAIGLVGGDEETDVELAFAREPEREIDPVLHLLVRAWFQDGHIDVPAQKARIGGHLRRVAPRIVAHDDDHAAVGMRAREVADGQRVGGDMKADAFHHAHRAQAVHLRTVDHRGGDRLVVGQDGADAVLLGDFRNRLDAIEEAGDGRAGIAGPEMRPSLGFEQPFDEQFVAEKDLRALFLEKSWIDLQVPSLVAVI